MKGPSRQWECTWLSRPMSVGMQRIKRVGLETGKELDRACMQARPRVLDLQACGHLHMPAERTLPRPAGKVKVWQHVRACTWVPSTSSTTREMEERNTPPQHGS